MADELAFGTQDRDVDVDAIWVLGRAANLMLTLADLVGGEEAPAYGVMLGVALIALFREGERAIGCPVLDLEPHMESYRAKIREHGLVVLDKEGQH